MEEQLEGLEHETKSKRSRADDEEESYDSRDEHEDELESPGKKKPSRSQNEDEIEPSERGQRSASQNNSESDDSDIVEVQPQSRGPVQRPLAEDEEVREGDADSKDDASSDIDEVQPQSRGPAQRPLSENREVREGDDDSNEDATSDIEEAQPSDVNSAKRPLEEEEKASYHAEKSNEGSQDQLAPTPKRAKIDEDSDFDGSVKSMTSGVDNLNEDSSSNIGEVKPPDTSSARRVEDEEEDVHVRDGNSIQGEKDKAPTTKGEDRDSDGSGYGSF